MGEGEVDLRGAFDLLRRRFRLIVMIVAGGLVIAAIAIFSLTPIYSASSLVLVDPSHKNLLDPETRLQSNGGESARIDSEVEILRSDSLLLKVLDTENLSDAALGEALSSLRNAATIQRRGLTYVIAIEAHSANPVEAARLANKLSSAYVDDQLRSKIDATLASRSILQARLTEVSDAIAQGATPRELQRRTDLLRNQRETLLARIQDFDAQAALQEADSRIVSPALVPLKPSSPNKPLLLAIAAFAALSLGLLAAFACENLIGGFTSEAQVASVLRTRVATAVPRQKGKSDRESPANLMVTAPLSVFSEAVRRLRAALEQSTRTGRAPDGSSEGRVVMVCSTAPDEGKTTLALSLVRAYALSGRAALLIDCDLRKPSVHRHLGIEPSQGLLEYLSADNSGTLASIVSRDALTPATIIVGAHRSDLPTDQLLTGTSFGRLIEAARRSFDIVVLDTPPMGPVVDGLYIAPFADALVFVTRWASTSQSDARQAMASLVRSKTINAEIVTVLNQQDETRAYHHRKYGTYYAAKG